MREYRPGTFRDDDEEATSRRIRSALNLPEPGYRDYSSGEYHNHGSWGYYSHGYYWTSTPAVRNGAYFVKISSHGAIEVEPSERAN